MRRMFAVQLVALALLAAGCPQRAEQQPALEGRFDLGIDTIGIGLVNPYSGPFGFFGTFVENSVKVEVERINAAGGLGGAMLTVVGRDMELNPQLAIQRSQELIADQTIQLIIGPPFTGFFNATKQSFEDAKKVNCAMAVAGPTALQGLKYAFRTQDPDQFRTVALMDYAKDELGIRSIGIVYENDDTGKGYGESIPKLAQDRGIDYKGIQFTRPDEQTHRGQVEALKDADAIIITNNSTNAAKTATAAAEIGYQGRLLGFSGLQGFTYVEGAGDASAGTIFASNYLGYFTEEPAEEWPKAYRDHVQKVIATSGESTGPKTGVKQYKGTGLAADCVVLFEKAVTAARSLDPDKVVAAWEKLNIPRDEMPSVVHARFSAADHEAYGAEDLYIYRWTKKDARWILETLVSPER